ncbi:MAG: polymer-forming cytoskeletal protein [bacterium]|nr:polymer-forming cytoskeletal protein [bacterium]
MALIRRDDPNLLAQSNSAILETHTVLGVGAEFEGKLLFKGSVKIDGKFIGEIISEDTMVIGEKANVKGNLQVGTLVVEGICRGHVKASTQVELRKTCQFYGTILSPSLGVEPGAKFEGECKMGATVSGAEDVVSGKK